MERAHDHRPPYHEFAIELERARREAGLKSKDLAEQLFGGPAHRAALSQRGAPSDVETTERWEQACGIEPGRLTSIHPEGAQFRPHLIEGGDAAVGDAARPRFPRRWAALIALVAVAAGAVAVGVSLQGGPSKTKLEQTVERAKSLRSTYPEKTGGDGADLERLHERRRRSRPDDQRQPGGRGHLPHPRVRGRERQPMVVPGRLSSVAQQLLRDGRRLLQPAPNTGRRLQEDALRRSRRPAVSLSW